MLGDFLDIMNENVDMLFIRLQIDSMTEDPSSQAEVGLHVQMPCEE